MEKKIYHNQSYHKSKGVGKILNMYEMIDKELYTKYMCKFVFITFP